MTTPSSGNANESDAFSAKRAPIEDSGVTTQVSACQSVSFVRTVSAAQGVASFAKSAGKASATGAAYSAVLCAAKNAIHRDKSFEGATVDVATVGVSAGLRSGAAKIVESAMASAAKYFGETIAEETAKVGVQETLKSVANETGKQAAKEVGKVIAEEASKQLVKQAALRTFKQAAVAYLRGNALGALAGLVVDQGVDSIRLASGKLRGAEYVERSAENAASAAGGFGGAAVGTAIGTALLPGVGTVLGSIAGGILGGVGLNAGAKRLIKRTRRASREPG
jgi:hypothetical protein